MDQLIRYVLDVIKQIAFLFLLAVAVIVVITLLAADKGVVKPVKRLERRAYRDTLTGLMN